MPKVKYTMKQAKAAAAADIIRLAFFRKGITEQYAMAAAAGISASSMSLGMKDGFSSKSLLKIHGVVGFTGDEMERLLSRP